MIPYKRPDCTPFIPEAIRLGMQLANYECRLTESGCLEVQKLIPDYEQYVIDDRGNCNCPARKRPGCKHEIIGRIALAYFTCPLCGAMPRRVNCTTGLHLMCPRCEIEGVASVTFQKNWLGRSLTDTELIMVMRYYEGVAARAKALLPSDSVPATDTDPKAGSRSKNR